MNDGTLLRVALTFAAEHPELVSLESIGKSHEGRDIWLMVLTRKPVLAYDIKSKGAESYLALAREFLRRRGAAK